MKKILFIVLCLSSMFIDASNVKSAINPESGHWYNDEFGPIGSNYSMGDFVRYTVTPAYGSVGVVPIDPVNTKYQNQKVGLNVYYNMVEIPYAQDAYSAVDNARNLYNFIGNLYAGYAALNHFPSEFLYGPKEATDFKPSYIFGASGTTFLESPWLTSFRQLTQGGNSGSLGFDNNPCGLATIYLVKRHVMNKLYSEFRNEPSAIPPFKIRIPLLYSTAGSLNGTLAGLSESTADMDKGTYFLHANFKGQPNNANSSCTWNTNTDDGNYVLAIPAWLNTQGNAALYDETVPGGGGKHPSWGHGCAAPYGQFFGARLAHILGAVTNDVPVSTAAAISATWPAMPTGTPTPQMAIFSGGPAAVAGSTTPSTAHFGSMMNFVNYWMANKVTPAIKYSTYYAYLAYHLLPTLQRFATGGPSSAALCSYALTATSTGANLIEIVDTNVTPYDNGLIVGIENNTGKNLYIKQCVKGAGDNQIGVLKQGSSNYFLHTASLMQAGQASASAAAGTVGQPPLGNVIEFKDMADGASVFVQVVDADQLQTIITNLNNALNNFASSAGGSTGSLSGSTVGSSSTTNNFVYNQDANSDYEQPTSNTPAYLVVSNFDSNNIANLQGNNLILARMQAINIGAFQGQPYFVTLQINKEQMGYGLESGQLMQGASDSYLLYPSILSVKTFTWLNPYAQTQGTSYWSQMPLLLLPDSVASAGIKGLSANYGIWLMSYAAALTEFQFNCQFGDTLDCLSKTFNVFSVTNQSAPARVVIDVNGVLQSGQMMTLQPTMSDQQANATYLTLMGCDVWDCGQNFNQDIPILHFYSDAAGNPVANQDGAEYTNLVVTFELEKEVKVAVQHELPGSLTTTNVVSDETQEVGVTTQLDNFADGYGQPYNNIMLFSIKTADLQKGVRIEWLQHEEGHYQIMIKDETDAHNVLAVKKVYLQDSGNLLQVFCNFINNHDAAWDHPVMIPTQVTTAPIGHTRSCILKYEKIGGNNQLSIVPVQTVVAKKAKKTDPYVKPVVKEKLLAKPEIYKNRDKNIVKKDKVHNKKHKEAKKTDKKKTDKKKKKQKKTETEN